MEEEDHVRSPKRGRYMSKWESSLYEKNSSTPSLSLQQLFDARRWQEGCLCTSSSSASSSSSNRRGHLVKFRLEHRQGGPTATHPGEERILLFRSDRKAVVGKIIYSLQEEPTTTTTTKTTTNETKDGNRGEPMAHAKIHVLDVKGAYRGYDFGGLLFSEALLSLRHRHSNMMHNDNISTTTSCDETSENDTYSGGGGVRCQLDAEEDIRRHNKLVGFYERLGCTVKPKARPQFLNNNDGESYRKIPMQIDLEASSTTEQQQQQHHTLVGNPGGFIPVLLLGGAGKKPGKLASTEQGDRVDWIMVEDGQEHVQFRTTHGRYLTVDSNGKCVQEETPNAGFALLRVSDRDQHVLSGDDCQDDHDQDENKPLDPWTEQELWVLMSPHQTYLNLDPASLQLEGSNTPAFWQANSLDLSLTCTTDTPTRRQHYRQNFIKQTVQYVQDAENRYRKFQVGTSSLRKALDLIKTCPAYPFRVDTSSRRLSLRTLCFRTAETARAAGHPDWIQFVALVHALGSVINCFDVKTAIESEDDFDWTILCCSRVVGCACPSQATFAEFRDLNSDQHDDHLNTPNGMYSPHCGLDNVKLTWSGPEYMCHMLNHNEVDLPEEAFSVLRLFLLNDWHSNNLYENLANDDDGDIHPFVSSFYGVWRRARQDSAAELSDAECDRLWDSHYSWIVAKFGADNELKW